MMACEFQSRISDGIFVSEYNAIKNGAEIGDVNYSRLNLLVKIVSNLKSILF